MLLRYSNVINYAHATINNSGLLNKTMISGVIHHLANEHPGNEEE